MKNRKHIQFTLNNFEKSCKFELYKICFYQPNLLITKFLDYFLIVDAKTNLKHQEKLPFFDSIENLIYSPKLDFE